MESGKTVDMPIGMAMSIAQNKEALAVFGTLPESKKTEFIRRAKATRTKEEMTKIVGEIAALR